VEVTSEFKQSSRRKPKRNGILNTTITNERLALREYVCGKFPKEAVSNANLNSSSKNVQ